MGSTKTIDFLKGMVFKTNRWDSKDMYIDVHGLDPTNWRRSQSWSNPVWQADHYQRSGPCYRAGLATGKKKNGPLVSVSIDDCTTH